MEVLALCQPSYPLCNTHKKKKKSCRVIFYHHRCKHSFSRWKKKNGSTFINTHSLNITTPHHSGRRELKSNNHTAGKLAF